MAHRAPSSSITYKWTYDVFLSFYGEDTRLGFTSHLHQALRQRGIRVFLDDECIRTGEIITPSLFSAIEESRIAIIVFSGNYAKSTFCLRELANILECFKEESRLIYPVFYHVDPSELRNPRESYAEALAQLEKRFKDERHKVEKWRLALCQAADLKGCHLKPKIANEQECITRITDEVAERINQEPLHVTNYPVGLVPRVKEVISYLDLWSNEKIKMIGIWGAGGIGKSTIARALYNSIADSFEGLCFLSNVRKRSKEPNGLSHLQETLLSKLVMAKDLNFGDYHEGIPIIQRRLNQKKILLILDDVDESDQLKALAGSCNWFSCGSRIIITSKDKQLLKSHGIENIYDVKGLNSEESLKLLSWYAFKKENVDSNYVEVCNRAVDYSCGFPLALEVIGSYLGDKGVNLWNSALQQFKRTPNERVWDALKLSYNTLGEVEKQVFLDLACFFNGEELANIIDILLCVRAIEPTYAIDTLVDKSLIKIEQAHVTMHNLIEDVGKAIVRQSSNDPGERSRLWFYQDILHVLQQDTGTNKVEAIILDLPENVEVQWSGVELMKMKNLKMLVIRNASFSESPKYLPNSLRWLEWKGYPFKFFPVRPTQLVYLDLSDSSCEFLQPCDKKFPNLSRMNLSNCKFLQQIPHLSGASNLTVLRLDDCTNLTEIHDSVGCLNKLVALSAMGCKSLKIFPSRLSLTSLELLNLSGCSSLQTFPEISGATNLTALRLDYCTNLTEIHHSIGCLNKLIALSAMGCKNLKIFPSRLSLTSLELLNLSGCSSLQTFPEISGPSNLTALRLDYCTNLTEIHDSVGCLNKLKALSAMGCKSLKIFPSRLSLTSLELLNLSGCSSLQTFPEIPIVMKEMHTLYLDKTPITELPSSVCNLIGLETLSVEECPNLKQLPASICTLPNLWNLRTDSCEGLSQFKMREGGDEASLYCSAMSLKMERLCFSNCNLSDDSLAFCLSYFTNMIHLDLSFNNFTILPECFKEYHNLKYLLLNNCIQLEHIGGMPPNLDKFSAICCASLTKSSKRKVFKKALNIQPGKTNFILPGKELPKGLHYYYQENSVSFWARNVFPMASLWILCKDHRHHVSNYEFSVRINDTKVDISSSMRLLLSRIMTDHIYICDMQSIILSTELPVNKWNRVEISFESKAKEIYFGVHVYNLQSNLENVDFMDSTSAKYVESLDNPMHYQDRDIMEKLRHYSYNNLIELQLINCKYCWRIPTLGQLHALRTLTIEGLESVVAIGSEFFHMDKPRHYSYNNLIELKLINCKYCWRIPALGQLPALRTLTLEGLERVAAIGSEFFHGDDSASPVPFPSLKTLHFENMISWEEWNSIEMDAFPNLRTLRFHDCPKLIGNLPRQLLSLKNMVIERCPLLASSIPNCPYLDKLVIIKSPNVVLQEQELAPSLSHLAISCTQMSEPLFEKMDVEDLIVWDCPDAVPLPVIHMPHSVKGLSVEGCENLRFLRSLVDDMKRLLPILTELFIKGCPELEPFSITLPSSLERLEIRECDKLLSCLTELNHLPTITQLCIYFPPATRHCKRLRHLTSQELQFLDSPNIEEIEGEIMPPSLQRLHICDYGFLLEQCRDNDEDIWPEISYHSDTDSSDLEIGTSSEDEDMNEGM